MQAYCASCTEEEVVKWQSRPGPPLERTAILSVFLRGQYGVVERAQALEAERIGYKFLPTHLVLCDFREVIYPLCTSSVTWKQSHLILQAALNIRAECCPCLVESLAGIW